MLARPDETGAGGGGLGKGVCKRMLWEIQNKGYCGLVFIIFMRKITD